MKPQQLAAALSRSEFLADEMGVGKTIGAKSINAQKWTEKHKKTGFVVPAKITTQWASELRVKVNFPSCILYWKMDQLLVPRQQVDGKSSELHEEFEARLKLSDTAEEIFAIRRRLI